MIRPRYHGGMPELPEVETIRRDLEPLLVGRRIAAVAIHAGAERLAVTHAPSELERALEGRRVEALGRQAGWEEVRRLHAALTELVPGADVPDPVRGQERTWQKTIEAWEDHLDGAGP